MTTATVPVLSNPRLVAIVPDWPLGGSKRGPCRFEVHHDKRGYRFSRTTTGKPKYTTYAGPCCVCDGSDGRTYLIQVATSYQFISVKDGDLKDARAFSARGTGSAAVFPDREPELHAALLALIGAAHSAPPL